MKDAGKRTIRWHKSPYAAVLLALIPPLAPGGPPTPSLINRHDFGFSICDSVVQIGEEMLVVMKRLKGLDRLPAQLTIT